MVLADYPFDVVNVSCRKCDRRGRYRKQTLVAKYGGAIAMPDLRWEIAADCSRALKQRFGTDPCGIVYPDLLMRYDETKSVDDHAE